ncbi:MAG: histidine phosphatase family protein [Myxococcales bacterium]|nr:histidine phosphatase family protein [Myxococcales bacterium]
MRRLVLLRHATSGWDGDPPTDHDRVLTSWGREEAMAVGAKLRAEGLAPERVLCSTALRAQETAKLAVGESPATTSVQELYTGGLHTVAESVGGLEPSDGVVWVVGHNPGLSHAASALSGRAVELAPGHAACLSVEAETWEEAFTLAGDWTLLAVATPGV